MAVNTVKTQNGIVVLLLTFLFGFLCGVGFSVWKLEPGSSSAPPETIPSQTALLQQITALLERVEADPEDGGAWAQLGNLYYDTNQPEKAVSAYLHSLELQPGSADLLTDLGVMYRRMHQPEKAISYFEQAAARDPSHLPSRFNKGIVLLNDLNRPQEAITTWEAIIQRNPDATTSSGQRIDEIIDNVKKNLIEKGKNK